MCGSAPVRNRILGVTAAAVAGVLALGGCTVTVPAPVPPAGVQATPPATYAAPTTRAGHDAAAVAARDMTFAAGNLLSPNVPVGYNDLLGRSDYASTAAAVPEWKQLKDNVAGQVRYSNGAGCQLAHWVTTNQGPLVTPGDDLASTQKLMEYLIPSVVPDSLRQARLPWAPEAGGRGRTISFQSYTAKASEGVAASTVWGRMLGTAGTGLVVTLSCPTDGLLASTTPRVMAKLAVAPPAS